MRQQIANMMLQPRSLAVQQEDFADYQRAGNLARARGSMCVAKHKGRWFAVIDGESRIPKVKARTNA